jgi:hypothetical protein
MDENDFLRDKANWEDKIGSYIGLYGVQTGLSLQPACSIRRIAMRSIFFDDNIIEEIQIGGKLQ